MKLLNLPSRFFLLLALLVVNSISLLPARAADSLSNNSPITFSGVPRACAGGVANEAHTIRLTARLSSQGRDLAGEKISFQWLQLPLMVEKYPQPYNSTLLGDDGQAIFSLEKTMPLNGEVKIVIRSGRHVTKSVLVALHKGREVGRVECDFASASEYRRFLDKEWPDEDGDSGWYARDGAKGRINNKVFLKFQRDDRRGDVSGNWTEVAGHFLRVYYTVTLRNGKYLEDFAATRPYLYLVDKQGKPTPSLTLTTARDGSVFFQHLFGDNQSDDEYNYTLEVDDLTEIGEDEALTAQATPLPMPPVAQNAWNQILHASAQDGAGFGDVVAVFPAPGIRGKLAVATTVSPGIAAVGKGTTLDVLQFPQGARSTHDLDLSNLYASYPLEFAADGRSLFLSGGPLPQSKPKPRDNSQDFHGGPPLPDAQDFALPQALYRFDLEQEVLRHVTPVSGSFPWFAISPDGRRLAFLHSDKRAPRASEALPSLLTADLQDAESEEKPSPPTTFQLGEMPLPGAAAQNQAALLRAFIQSFSSALPSGTMENSVSWTERSTLLASAREPTRAATDKNKIPPVYANTFELNAGENEKLILGNAWRATRSPDGKQTAFFTFENGVKYDPKFDDASRSSPYGTALHVQRTGEKPRLLGRVLSPYPAVFWLPDGRLLSCESWLQYEDKTPATHKVTTHFDLYSWNTQTGARESVGRFRAPAIDRALLPSDYERSTWRDRDSFTPFSLSPDGERLFVAYRLQGGQPGAFPSRLHSGASLTIFYAIDLKDGAIAPLAAARGARGFNWWNG